MELPDDMRTPEPVVVNRYWTLYPVPKKELFRDMLTLETPPTTIVKQESRPLSPTFVAQHDAPMEQTTRLLLTTRRRGEDKAAQLQAELDQMDHARQDAIMQDAHARYTEVRKEEEQNAPAVAQLKEQNERTAKWIGSINQDLAATKRTINTMQRAVLEVELERAPDLSPRRYADVFDRIAVSSRVKTEVNDAQATARNLMRPLRRHIVTGKNKYVKSGAFTKQKRAEKTQNARSYKKTGRHINDYQNPRFPQQRDRQLAERAAKLGLPEEQLRRALVGEQ